MKLRPKYPHVIVYTNNLDGNACYIMTAVAMALRNVGCPEDEIEIFRQEATAANYENVLMTAMRWVTMVRIPGYDCWDYDLQKKFRAAAQKMKLQALSVISQQEGSNLDIGTLTAQG